MRRAVLCLLMLLLPAIARAGFPNRPLRIVVGFSPGGTGDLVSRLVVDMARSAGGQNPIVDTRTGANGMIAAGIVARGPADGSAVLQCPMGIMSVAPVLTGSAPSAIDVAQELVPLVNIALSSYGMVVASQSEFHNVADFLAAARARPGRLTYASSGIGSTQNLAGEMLKRLAGVDLIHVPYRGGPPAVIDIMAGRTDTLITNLAEVARHVQSGGLRLLALGDDLGSPVFPDAPPLGASVPGFAMASWFGLCGPRGMPPEAIAAWAEAIRLGLQDAAVRERLSENGLTAHFEAPDIFADRVQRERTSFGAIIRAAGIHAE